MPTPAAPQRGYRNCSQCGAWLPVSSFPVLRTRRRDGTPIDPPQSKSWCEACERRRCREAAQLAARVRVENRVLSGVAVYPEPIRAWAEAQVAAGRSWAELAGRAGTSERALRKALYVSRTIDVGMVDGMLLEANESLDEMYPPPELPVAA